jgi:hypothetical protein
MKTIADFKRRLKPGVKIETIYHQATTGHRDENGKLRLFNENRGIRPVNIVQSNSFTLLTENKEGKLIDSWMSYPKSKEAIFIDDNTIQILTPDFRDHSEKLIPCVTYTFIE